MTRKMKEERGPDNLPELFIGLVPLSGGGIHGNSDGSGIHGNNGSGQGWTFRLGLLLKCQ